MNQAEIIQGQIELLVQLNRELASLTSPEATREIRENIKLITELAGVKLQGIVEDLEERLNVVEDVLFGEDGPDPEIMKMLEDYTRGKTSLMLYIRDCRDDIDSVYAGD